jgi:hypothetical protein
MWKYRYIGYEFYYLSLSDSFLISLVEESNPSPIPGKCLSFLARLPSDPAQNTR